jgi:hypothetical protein
MSLHEQPKINQTLLSRLIGCHGSKIEIKGCFFAQGPQVVGEHGVPQWVMDAFNNTPKLERLAICDKEGRGVVWLRPSEAEPVAAAPALSDGDELGD